MGFGLAAGFSLGLATGFGLGLATGLGLGAGFAAGVGRPGSVIALASSGDVFYGAPTGA